MLEVFETTLANICGCDRKVDAPEDHDVTADGHLLLPPVRQTHPHHLGRVHRQQSCDDMSWMGTMLARTYINFGILTHTSVFLTLKIP